ncbi:MAG TPA: ATP-binding protein [Pyrinomonadaceae bacterium]
MTFSTSKLEEIIASASFDTLLGEIENEWFECKAQPYALDGDSGKRELAKDVSSFANSLGGHILIGVKTKTSPTHYGDEVEKIRPFDQSLVNTDQYQKIIRDWVYPDIEGIGVRWVATKDDVNKGIVAITIPPQKDSSKPFLVKKVLDGKKQVEVMFGYAERRRDTSQPLSVVDIQKALRLGFNYESNLNVRFESLEALVRLVTENAPDRSSHEVIAELIAKRIETVLEEGELNGKRAMVLTAYPSRPNEIEGIFTSSASKSRGYIENPPMLRRDGFNLRTHEAVRIIRGELIRARSGGYKIIDLYRDGTLIFAVEGGGNFLTWATPRGEQRINPVTLVEIIYNFVNLYGLLLEDFREKPDRMFFRVDLRNLHSDGVKSYLPPYAAGHWGYMEKNYAPDESVVRQVEVGSHEFDVGRVSFQILRIIYSWFGLEEDKIPYLKTEDEARAVDHEQVVKLT